MPEQLKYSKKLNISQWKILVPLFKELEQGPIV